LAELNDKGKKVFALKYSTGKTKTWKDMCHKISDFIADAELVYGLSEEETKKIADEYFDMLYNLEVLPGGRIIANAGTGIKNLANCFVIGIEDSRSSIYQTLKNAAEIFAMGGGVNKNVRPHFA
jgi:ribonucleoside-diphosphate reductase alpha chain